MKKTLYSFLTMFIAIMVSHSSFAGEEGDIFLVHLKTSLKKDDAQICVAYNVIWAALVEGKNVKVLVDADAVNTYKVGWGGKNDIEGYELPEHLRVELSSQFGIQIDSVPKTYGEYLIMLKDKGASFYINRGMLIVSKIGTPDDSLKKISVKFFKPVTLKEMTEMMGNSKKYVVY